MEFNDEDLAQQAQESACNSSKWVANLAAESYKRTAHLAMRRVGQKISQGARMAGKAIANGAGGGAQALVRSMARFAKIGRIAIVAILILILLFAVSFNYTEDERGSAGQVHLNPTYENPTSMTKDGYLKAIALTEPQAIIDAYYKYMACDSHQKVYYDPNTDQIIDLQFSNVDETADFAALIDLYEHERAYYLSSYFIKMADELLHDEQFFFPEQIIKPVFAQFLPTKDDASKKYITTLPIVDDGSDHAKAMKTALNAAVGTTPTDVYANLSNAYAISESLESADAQPLKVEWSEDATYSLLALSKEYETSDVTVSDVDGNSLTLNKLVNQGENLTQGVWDYGFGSILQYEPMIQDKYISCSKASFTYHIHDKITWTDENDIEQTLDICHSSPTCEITFGVDTYATVTERMTASVAAPSIDDGGRTHTQYIKYSPSANDLITMLSSPDHVELKILSADKSIAGRVFDNDILQSVFGNGDRSLMTMAEKYPLKVAVLSSVATFSGNIRYIYEDVVVAEELTDKVGTATTFSENWSDDCTKIKYMSSSTSGCTFEGIITRAGQVIDQYPAPVEEIKVPMGFQYLEAYDNHYQIYVSDLVNDDRDFQKRIQLELASYVGNEDLDMNDDQKITIMDYMLQLGLLQPYFGNSLSALGDGMFSYSNLSAESAALMNQAGCTADADGEVELLAKAIACEAGPNKLDQLMVASVVVNRVHSAVYPNQNTIIDVLSAPGQYSTWPDRIMNATPTDEMRASARQVLSGEFATASNIIFQAGFTQGDGIFLINVNGPGFYTHYYCYKGATLSTLDIFNRPAATNETAIRSMAEQLHQKDISEGVSTTTNSTGSGIPTPGQIQTAEISNDYQLFAVDKFDTISAIRYMQNVAEKERSSVTLWSAFMAGLKDLYNNIFKSAAKAFGSPDEKNFVNMFNHNIALIDMQNTVIQAVTFINQDTYSTVADDIDPSLLQFIFVGDFGGLGMGTLDSSANMMPGVGSVFEGFGSPTNSHYNVSTGWTESSGQVIIAVPEGETVVAVGDGSITSISGSDAYEVTISAVSDGKSLIIIYGNLMDTSVVNGQSVSKGSTIGHAGPGGLSLKLLVDGINVDPMEYFYRPQYGGGIGFTNLLDASGNIDSVLVQALKETLNATNSNITNTYDIYHTSWRSGGKSHQSVGECTWWAYGRGLQYCEQNGTLPASGFKNGYGNGGDYRTQASQQFKTGNVARAGAWIVWGNPPYGHVGFVEAVGADGSIVVSQSGRGYWDRQRGAGVNVSIIKNSGSTNSPNYKYGSGYTFAGFVYLDQPL